MNPVRDDKSLYVVGESRIKTGLKILDITMCNKRQPRADYL